MTGFENITIEGLTAGATALGVNSLVTLVVLLAGLLVGYVLGMIVGGIVSRILSVRELKEQIAESDILSLKMWGGIVKTVATYVKFLVLAVVLHISVSSAVAMNKTLTTISGYTYLLQVMMGAIGVFLTFAIAGIIIGVVLYRILNSILLSLRIDERLAKHGLADALGGLSMSSVLSGIFMVYLVLVFLAQGMNAAETVISSSSVAKAPEEGVTVVSTVSGPLIDMFNNLMRLYPSFILGGLIIIAGAVVADFVSTHVSKSKSILADEFIAQLARGLILFFAVMIALPRFQIPQEDISIVADSFKIIVAGISIGLAIAIGLGMKEVMADIGKKIEKKL